MANKPSTPFKTAIESHLNGIAAKDTAFAAKLSNPAKSIDECITYIFNTVQKSGCNGFEDSEIFGMAMHYYDEEKIDVGKAPANMKVVVNHTVELTEEEKAAAKQKALDQAVNEAREKMSKKPVKKAAPATATTVNHCAEA